MKLATTLPEINIHLIDMYVNRNIPLRWAYKCSIIFFVVLKNNKCLPKDNVFSASQLIYRIHNLICNGTIMSYFGMFKGGGGQEQPLK